MLGRSEVEVRAISTSAEGRWARSSEDSKVFLKEEGAVVERRLPGRLRVRPFLTRLSVLPWTLRGGVKGCERGGGSVGRSAAGR